MIRIMIGPDAIKSKGLDTVTKSVIKEIHKLSNENGCEILFLMGITNNDVNYMLRNMIRLLDMPLIIMTRVNIEDIEKSVDRKGNELDRTLKVM
ncbi:MAG: hypothetical protein OXD54_05355 [Candidatus Poribacteria bacterium]|nr:hypothetical protein [Candidatus Poribacteria bacterium]